LHIIKFWLYLTYMKNTIKIIALLLLINSVQAQSERAVAKGKNSVNIYYGYNVFTDLFKNAINDNASNTKFKALGPVGLVYEHMMTESVGLGVEAGYGSITISGNYESTDYDSNNNTWVTGTYEEKINFTTIRAMVRLNIHFVKDENFDCYFLTSAGYRNTKYSYTNSNPYWTTAFNFNSPLNFGVKPGLGIRYFFSKAIGAHAEIAIGTPIACAGLSFRF
jgi:hypothetical protein